jgi:hypothetical protein
MLYRQNSKGHNVRLWIATLTPLVTTVLGFVSTLLIGR